MAQLTTRKRITKNGETRWEYRFEALPVNGRRRQVTKGGYATKKEAYTAGTAAYKRYYETGEVYTPSRETYETFAVKYLEENIYPGLARSTIKGYGHALAQIMPALGHLPISSITPTQIMDVYSVARNKGYSNGILLKIRTVLYKTFAQAVSLRMIAIDPTYGLDFPGSLQQPEEKEAYTAEEVKAIIECFPKNDYRRLIVAIAAYTGARESEVGGLTVENLDVEKKTITYDHQIQRLFGHEDIGGLWVWDKQKTQSSIRTIPISSALLSEITDAQAHIKERKEALGKAYKIPVLDPKTGLIRVDIKATDSQKELNLLCPRPEGEPSAANVYHEIAKWLRRRGFTAFSMHRLRHSHATLLLEADAPVVDVAHRLGHARTTTTLNVYAHSQKTGQVKTAEIFDDIMGVEEENE